MNRDRTSSSNDPTAERAVDQSTPSASGVGRQDRDLAHGSERNSNADRGLPRQSDRDPAAKEGPGVERNRDQVEDVVNRTGPNTTPRRYEQPVDEDETVMPANDSTLNTKI
jgi:hypothetical protein